MKSFLGTLLLILSCRPQSPIADKQALHTQLGFALSDTKQLARTVNYLAAAKHKGRYPGTYGYQTSVEYIESHLKSLNIGFIPKARSYKIPFSASNTEYFNLAGMIPGDNNQESIVLGAHLDHLRSEQQDDYPGADDNASGVALILELAKLFANATPRPGRNLIFAFFSAEERHPETNAILQGSKALVGRLKKLTNLAYMMNFDMVGNADGESGQTRKLLAWGFGSSKTALSTFKKIVAGFPITVKYEDRIAPNSDHWHFYSADVPIGMFHTGLHPRYHKPSDKPDTVDHEGLALLTQLAAQYVGVLSRTKNIDFASITGPGMELADHEYVGCAYPNLH